MPELPEVETTRLGILPHINGQTLSRIITRHTHLRWPIPNNLTGLLQGQRLSKLCRRGKYLLFEFESGTLILHLGMSGRLRVLTETIPPQKHDHIDLCFANGVYLRFTDPRRFGALLFTKNDAASHPLIKDIGPEPLTKKLSGDYLWKMAQEKNTPVKSFVMNNKVVAGVGNIYATESLFLAGIAPYTPAKNLSLSQYQKLAHAIKTILKKAIQKGGTTLRDFQKSDGTPGYFSIELNVYGKDGTPCLRCHHTLKLTRIGQRSTVYCDTCQR